MYLCGTYRYETHGKWTQPGIGRVRAAVRCIDLVARQRRLSFCRPSAAQCFSSRGILDILPAEAGG